MAFHITIPEKNIDNISSKDIILSILSNEWPLNIQEIFTRTKKLFSKNITYQAIFKSIKILEKKGVLIKHNKKFIISGEWLKETHDYIKFLSDSIKENNTNQNNTNILTRCKDIHILEFNGIKSYLNFIKQFENDLMVTNINKQIEIFKVVNHNYKLLFNTSEEYDYIKKLKRNGIKLTILCNGNTNIDNWMKSFYEENGISVKTNANFGASRHINIYDNRLLEIFYSHSFNKILEDIHHNSDSIHDINISRLLEKANMKENKISVVINNNEWLVKNMRNIIQNHLKESICIN